METVGTNSGEKAFGTHRKVEEIPEMDINGRYMAMCNVCYTCAHASSYEEAKAELNAEWNYCSPWCENCKSLRESHRDDPARPEGGNQNTVLHVCPYDGNRWWQSNTYYHLWQRVTSDREWQGLKARGSRSTEHSFGDFY